MTKTKKLSDKETLFVVVFIAFVMLTVRSCVSKIGEPVAETTSSCIDRVTAEIREREGENKKLTRDDIERISSEYASRCNIDFDKLNKRATESN